MVRSFADCTIDTDRGELRRAGMLVPVEPQVFELLAYLIVHPDRIVTKDELNEAIGMGALSPSPPFPVGSSPPDGRSAIMGARRR